MDCVTCGVDRGKAGCTNRRCRSCHSALCTPGGNTSPGHGLGSVESENKYLKLNKESK